MECEKGTDRKRVEKDELEKKGIGKTEGSKEGERQRDRRLLGLLVEHNGIRSCTGDDCRRKLRGSVFNIRMSE